MSKILPIILVLIILSGCTQSSIKILQKNRIRPDVVTQPVKYDSDDPAIWINKKDPEKSMILGTDKETDGAIFVFDLEGNVIDDKVVRNIKRPNNIDVEYGFSLGEKEVDIAVFTEREAESIRVFSLPDMLPIDNGGIQVFKGEKPVEFRSPMGVAIYKQPETGNCYVILSRKNGPQDGTYLWQYQLNYDQDKKSVDASLVRKFGDFSGQKEIEAIAVDDAMGLVYFSEEKVGVKQYYADPQKGNEEIQSFGEGEFKADVEGIAILNHSQEHSTIIISDQTRHAFRFYKATRNSDRQTKISFIKTMNLSTRETDGCEVSGYSFGKKFPNGFFVAMSDDRTFHYYDLSKLSLTSE